MHKACIIEQPHFKGGEMLFKRAQKISLSASYCTVLSAKKENEKQDRKGEIDIIKKKVGSEGEIERESERNVIFPLRMSGSLVCDMSVSVGTSCLSLPICFFFFPSHYPLLHHPLLLLYFSCLYCLVIAQPCHISFFLCPHIHKSHLLPPSVHAHICTDTHMHRHTETHLSCVHSKSDLMFSSFQCIYLSL